jgi:hypothetical protein
MKTPWRISESRKRVTIIDADGRVMTEILPAQVLGKPVTQEERMAIAARIVEAVNR